MDVFTFAYQTFLILLSSLKHKFFSRPSAFSDIQAVDCIYNVI